MSCFPSTIYILRHAEKPSNESDEKLSTKGRERAAALAYYFPSIAPDIGYIFAAGFGHHSPSHRPVETVAPLAQRLNKDVNEEYLKDDYCDLVKYILGDSKYTNEVIVVCWEHTFIEDICNDFGATNVPEEKWPDCRFDLVWRLDYQANQTYQLTQIPQLLMYGDQDTIIGPLVDIPLQT